MRSFILTILLSMMWVCASAQTLPTSDQVESLIRNGELEQAKIYLQQVLDVKPDSPKANYYMAQLVNYEKGDISQYKPKYEPYLLKVTQEEEKQRQLEAAEAKESMKSFLKFLGFIVITILVIGALALFLPDYLNDLKEKKRKEEGEKQRLLAEEEQRRELLKEILAINEELKSNIFKDEEKAKEHRNYALDAIEILSEKGDYDLSLISTWKWDVRSFIIMEKV